MPDLSRLLHRFRRLGAPPGAPATGVGVPARPGDALLAELTGVFRAVDEIERAAQQIRVDGGARADRILADAHVEAAGLHDLARRRAAKEQATIAEARARTSAEELARIAADAEAEALRIADVASTRETRLVAMAIEPGLHA